MWFGKNLPAFMEEDRQGRFYHKQITNNYEVFYSRVVLAITSG